VASTAITLQITGSLDKIASFIDTVQGVWDCRDGADRITARWDAAPPRRWNWAWWTNELYVR
jgi:hypothetical protein